jgi:hypothetical protein
VVWQDTFVKAFGSFNLRKAFPDLSNDAYDFRVDPYDPSRVWFTVRCGMMMMMMIIIMMVDSR